MMKPLLFFAFFFLCLNPFAQNKKSVTEKKASAISGRNDSVEYLNHVIEFLNEVEGEHLSDSLFVLEATPFDYGNCLPEIMKQYFTSQEKMIIKKEAAKPRLPVWTASVLPKIKILSTDSLEHILGDYSKGWTYFHSNVGHAIHKFSSPIFLRNYTYCIFYSVAIGGKGSLSGNLHLYQKIKGRWVEKKRYCGMIA